jgi:hypothetical protein
MMPYIVSQPGAYPRDNEPDVEITTDLVSALIAQQFSSMVRPQDNTRTYWRLGQPHLSVGARHARALAQKG